MNKAMFYRIQKAADVKGISIKELGLKIGIGENTIYKWKKSSPGIDNLKKVAEYLDVSLDYLVLGKQKREQVF